MSDLYGRYEQSREKAWALKQDAKALAKLRDTYAAEREMAENVRALQAKTKQT